jgi:hypothetical protein
MTWRRWDDDAYLLTELVAALSAPGQTPPGFLDMAKGAFAWRTVDDDLALAALAYDSLLDEGLSARARSQGSTRGLVFTGDGLSVEIQVTGDGIVGQLGPAGRGEISVYTPDGLFAEATADDIGAFTVELPPPGPVRLRCQAGEARFITDWICL